MIGVTRITSSTTASAEATGQSRFQKNSSHSTCPIIVVADEPSRSGMTNSPVIGMKQSRQPATIPGSESGTVTVLNTRHGGAPRSAAASSNVSSMRSSAAYSGCTINGKYEQTEI